MSILVCLAEMHSLAHGNGVSLAEIEAALCKTMQHVGCSRFQRGSAEDVHAFSTALPSHMTLPHRLCCRHQHHGTEAT